MFDKKETLSSKARESLTLEKIMIKVIPLIYRSNSRNMQEI